METGRNPTKSVLKHTDLPEVRFKVKNNHRLFHSASFNREVRGKPFTTYIFPEAPKIPNKPSGGRDSVLENLESHALLC